ncbi:uncharacterized protein LOC117648113 isoform X2 [Thrips palmi]|uniref:Uncharacterized protein LOC117648113 isoform X2 n=1 Tax=Thrips palmi TaxID=161013 RepID=A0A6P8ZCD0_THRPL|nr:uncharacterized protein LOC117648113 isoform X2 [Thrips palmi]
MERGAPGQRERVAAAPGQLGAGLAAPGAPPPLGRGRGRTAARRDPGADGAARGPDEPAPMGGRGRGGRPGADPQEGAPGQREGLAAVPGQLGAGLVAPGTPPALGRGRGRTATRRDPGADGAARGPDEPAPMGGRGRGGRPGADPREGGQVGQAARRRRSPERYEDNAATMDAFPDELLLEVLGRIDNDALTLLDVVPLVCKRWHRLSRDPGAWSSVTVSIVGCSYFGGRGNGKRHVYHHDEMLEAARILLHAPALRRVCFEGYGGAFSCPNDAEAMASALVRSRAEVREIEFPQPHIPDYIWYPSDPLDDMSPEDLSQLVDFLWRNRSHVRYLKLGQMLRAGEPVLRALGQCENLEELHLMLPDPNYFRYQGQLGGRRLPKLRRLTLNSWYNVDGYRAFLEDLVGCVAQSVRHVRCEESCESSEDVLSQLSRCVELRSLHCGLALVASARTQTKLRSLSLGIYDKDPYEDPRISFPYGEKDQQGVWSAAERALRACGELQALQELRLDIDDCYGHDSQALAMLLATVLATLATKATNVRHLSHSGMLNRQLCWSGTMLGFFKALPRLESLHIDYFRFDCLPDLAEVAGLKRVSGQVTYRKGEADVCRDALEQFKRARPEVDCQLTEHESLY